MVQCKIVKHVSKRRDELGNDCNPNKIGCSEVLAKGPYDLTARRSREGGPENVLYLKEAQAVLQECWGSLGASAGHRRHVQVELGCGGRWVACFPFLEWSAARLLFEWEPVCDCA